MPDSPKIELPALPLEAWEQSKITLNLYLQVVGKIQLALMPRKNHWWYITLLVNAKGLITHTMPANGLYLEIQFNFPEHRVEFMTSGGSYESFPLHDGLSVADFYKKTFAILDKLGIHVKILARPYSLPDANPIMTPFVELTEYHSYDPDAVSRFWKALLWSDAVFHEFSGRFYGKTSPPQVFWHHMDLAVTRFCGKKAPVPPPGTNIANREAYSHEEISFGFWAGDEKIREAAYYSYTFPSPQGIQNEILKPAAAKWINSNGSPMALLTYDNLRAQPDPRQALLDFLESCYLAGARLSAWDIAGNYCGPLQK